MENPVSSTSDTLDSADSLNKMDPNNLVDHIAYAAFRYTLGRMSYSVWDMTRFFKKHIASISADILSKMVSDISEAERNHRLGHECDKKDWLSLRSLLENRSHDREAYKDLSVEEIESLSIYATRHLMWTNEPYPHLSDFLSIYMSRICYTNKVLLIREISDHSTRHPNWMDLLRIVQY